MADQTQWRQDDRGNWQYRASDGYWYAGEGPPAPGLQQDTQSGQWYQQAPDGTLHTYGPSPGEGDDGYDRDQPVTAGPVGAWFAIIAGVLLTISAFLPWLSASSSLASISRSGFQLGANDGFSADGVIALALGVVTVGIGIARLTNSRMPRWLTRSTIVTGIGAGLLFASDIGSVVAWERGINDAHPQLFTAQVGIGLILLAVAAGVAVVAGLVLRRS